MFEIGAMSIALSRLVDGDEPSCEQILHKASDLGLDGVEFYESDFGGGPGDPEQAEGLRHLAESLGLSLFAIGSAARLGYHDERKVEAMETLRRQVDVAAAVGARSVTFAAIDSQPVPADRDAAQGGLPFGRAVAPLAAQMRELADYGRERSVDIAVLNHCYFVCTSWHQDWAVRLAGADNAGACLDPGNYLFYEGEDPVAATQRLSGSVAAVRLGDMRCRGDAAIAADFADSGQLRVYEAAVFGEGDVDHATCLQLLRDSGYDGFLSIKSVGSSPQGPADAFRRSLDSIRRLVSETLA